jgi:hypothetical protein
MFSKVVHVNSLLRSSVCIAMWPMCPYQLCVQPQTYHQSAPHLVVYEAHVPVVEGATVASDSYTSAVHCATSQTLCVLQGSATYAPEKSALVWHMRNFPGGKEYMLR